MKSLNRILILLFFLFLISCNDDSEIIIAVVGDISAENQNLGNQLKSAAHFFAEHINKNNDVGISAKFYDDKGNNNIARQIALQLVSDPRVICVVGHSTSSTTKAAQEIYSTFKMPILVPIATYSDLNTAETNAFRMVPSNQQQATLIAALISKLERGSPNGESEYPGSLIYYEPSNYGSDLGEKIAAAIVQSDLDMRSKKKLTLNERNAIRTGPAREDYRDFSDIGYVIFAGYHHQAKELIKELAGADEENRTTFIMTDGCKDYDFFNGFGHPSLTSYLTFVSPDWQNPLDINPNPDYNEKLKLVSQELLKSESSSKKVLRYEPIAIDALKIILDIASSNQLDWKSSSDLKNLIKVKLLSSDKKSGFFRDYSFDIGGELSKGKAFLYEVRKLDNNSGDFIQVNLQTL